MVPPPSFLFFCLSCIALPYVISKHKVLESDIAINNLSAADAPAYLIGHGFDDVLHDADKRRHLVKLTIGSRY